MPGGTSNLYDRIRVTVTAGGVPVEAWAYEYLRTTRHESYIPVEHGDWRRFMTERGLAAGADKWADTIPDRSHD